MPQILEMLQRELPMYVIAIEVNCEVNTLQKQLKKWDYGSQQAENKYKKMLIKDGMNDVNKLSCYVKRTYLSSNLSAIRV